MVGVSADAPRSTSATDVETLTVDARHRRVRRASRRSRTCRSRCSPGTVHAVIGPNGAGKSTMFNVLSGVYRATAGEVRLGDTVLNGLRPHQIAAPRRRPGLPEHRAVGHPDGRREPDARAPRPDPGGLPRVRAAAAEGDPRGQAARRARPGDRGVPRARRQAATSRSASCPTATRSGSRWPGRCAPSRGCCCSTSRWPA